MSGSKKGEGGGHDEVPEAPALGQDGRQGREDSRLELGRRHQTPLPVGSAAGSQHRLKLVYRFSVITSTILKNEFEKNRLNVTRRLLFEWAFLLRHLSHF